MFIYGIDYNELSSGTTALFDGSNVDGIMFAPISDIHQWSTSSLLYRTTKRQITKAIIETFAYSASNSAMFWPLKLTTAALRLTIIF